MILIVNLIKINRIPILLVFMGVHGGRQLLPG